MNIYDLNNLRCPVCGGSYYKLIDATQTAVYYPPIFENGINVNPDGNIITYTFKCLDCLEIFTVKIRYGQIIEIAPVVANE